MTPKGVKMRNPLLEQIYSNLLNIQGFSKEIALMLVEPRKDAQLL